MKQFPNHKFYKKNHLVIYKKKSLNRKNFRLKFNNIGIQSKSNINLNYKQLDSGRKILKKNLKKKGNIIIRVNPWAVKNKKSIGMRMGKGKGSKREWFCPIKKGTIVYEIYSKNFFFIKKSYLKCKKKMPFVSKMVNLVF